MFQGLPPVRHVRGAEHSRLSLPAYEALLGEQVHVFLPAVQLQHSDHLEGTVQAGAERGHCTVIVWD